MSSIYSNDVSSTQAIMKFSCNVEQSSGLICLELVCNSKDMAGFPVASLFSYTMKPEVVVVSTALILVP